MDQLRLVVANQDYAKQIWDFRAEVLERDADTENRFAGCSALEEYETVEAWLEHCDLMKDPNTPFIKDSSKVPSHVYLALRQQDDRLVGIIDLRHHINHPILSVWGGHCGYSVRPSERKKGYGTEMLRLVIEKARDMGIPRLLITCDDDNAASEKVIRANGGVFERIVEDHGSQIKRYWINV